MERMLRAEGGSGQRQSQTYRLERGASAAERTASVRARGSNLNQSSTAGAEYVMRREAREDVGNQTLSFAKSLDLAFTLNEMEKRGFEHSEATSLNFSFEKHRCTCCGEKIAVREN